MNTPPPYVAVFIDSFAQPKALDKKNVLILPGTKDVDPSDLQFLEFAGHVATALKEMGLTRVERFQDADVAVYLSYGIGNPQTQQYSYALPTWGQTGVSSATTYGSVNRYGNTGTFSGTTVYTPTYGITGYSTQVESRTTFTRFLLMDAYDIGAYKKTQEMKQLWKIGATSAGSSNDLRFVFPYMVVASQKFLGTNTGRRIEEDVLIDDPRVATIRANLNDQRMKQ